MLFFISRKLVFYIKYQGIKNAIERYSYFEFDEGKIQNVESILAIEIITEE